MKPIGKFPTLYVLLALLSLSTLFAGLTADSFHSWGGDFSLYIQQAEALLKGTSQNLYRVNAYAMEHSEIVLGPHLYPPGFPLMLSPIIFLVGKNLLAMKWVVIACFILFQWVMYVYFRPFLSPFSTLTCVASFSLNPWLIRYCDFIHSDIPFLLFCFLSLWLTRKFYEGELTFFSSLVLGLLIGFACLIRSVGLVLIMAFLLLGLLYKMEKSSTPKSDGFLGEKGIAVLLTCILVLMGSEYTYPSGTGSYMNYLEEYGLSKLGDNLVYYWSLPYLHLGGFSLPVYLFGIPLIAWGIVRHFSSFKLEILFTFLYFSALLIWPFADGLRFLFPLLPFLALFFFLGLNSFFKWLLEQSSFRYNPASYSMGIIALFFAGCLYNVYRDFPPQAADKVGSPASKELFLFIQNNLKDEDLIYFYRPRILRLYTGKKSIAKKSPLKCSEKKPFFLILHKLEEMSVCENITEIFANEEFIVLHAQMDI